MVLCSLAKGLTRVCRRGSLILEWGGGEAGGVPGTRRASAAVPSPGQAETAVVPPVKLKLKLGWDAHLDRNYVSWVLS